MEDDHESAPGGTRTRTTAILSRLPLPLGYGGRPHAATTPTPGYATNLTPGLDYGMWVNRNTESLLERMAEALLERMAEPVLERMAEPLLEQTGVTLGVSCRLVERDRIGSPTGTLDVPSALPDLAQLQLAELLSQDDSVLHNALQRILSESDTHDIVAGFNSAI